MTNPTLRQFVEASTFDNQSTGLPQGDTFFSLDTAIVEKYIDNRDEQNPKVKYKIMQDNKSFVVPTMVHKEIQRVARDPAKFARVRITRTGTGKTDTRYTVVGVQ